MDTSLNHPSFPTLSTSARTYLTLRRRNSFQYCEGNILNSKQLRTNATGPRTRFALSDALCFLYISFEQHFVCPKYAVQQDIPTARLPRHLVTTLPCPVARPHTFWNHCSLIQAGHCGSPSAGKTFSAPPLSMS